jgi:Tol biopolymer transport system component/predicted Ser/Thr protein kinase
MKSGQMLAHYRVEEQIGRGGMGEVFRAHDTTLGRDVAIKILPAEFANDRDRLARFQREAKVLASLNHPNIASIFGFETSDDLTFLVMELVEGEDLAEVLRSGALPVEEAVDIARQIAEGLEEAHEKGIVHRDLKPANVKRTPDGKVKVLDFGLARAISGQSVGQTAGEECLSSAPTMTAAMTQMGTVLGTAAYMSPEQARGKEVDRRADIWAFGVILFEMLTGKQLFTGETASDTLAGILKSEPRWEQLPEGVPFQVERVLRRCLAKDPRQRLRDIGEARVRLEDPDAESGMFSGSISAAAGGGDSRFRRWLPWMMMAASLAVAVMFVWIAANQTEEETLHLAVPAPAEVDIHITGSYPGLPEISPDGNFLAFSGRNQEDKSVQLYVRALGDFKPVALSDTKDAQYPFWSPDGKWLGFYSRAEGLMKIPVDGGPPQLVCAATNGKGGSWNKAGDILLTTDYNTSILTVKAAGGEARPVTDLAADKGFNSHRHPQFLPDGKHFLYLARGSGKTESEIRFASLDGGPAKVVTKNSAMGYYASGHLVFLSHGDLVAQPFDPSTGTMSGSPTPLVEDVLEATGAAKGAFSVSSEGTLAYMQGQATQEGTVTWRDRSGREIEQVGDLASFSTVVLSPDTRSAAVGIIDQLAGTNDLWIIDLERKFRTRFTTDPLDDINPVWSSDSRGVFFLSDRVDNGALFFKEVGSPDEPNKLYSIGEYFYLNDVSNDGKTVFYSTAGEGTGWDLWCAALNSQSEPRLLRRTAASDLLGCLSPDGKWLAFTSAESGQWQVYVAPWPAMSPLTQVSTTSGIFSAWCKDGREMIFQESDGPLVAVSMTPEEGRMRVGPPERLFDFSVPEIDGVQWDVAPDGERFITVNSHDAAVPSYCNLVLNWPQMLEGR